MTYGYQYPAVPPDNEKVFGIYPVDFIFEQIIEDGLDWFRNTPEAPEYVYGHLKSALLNDRYGQGKIDEIKNYIEATEIRVSQAWPTGSEVVPVISINLASGVERIEHAGMDDFDSNLDTLGVEELVEERREIGYTPINDELLIGIHSAGSPDTVKYIHMLLVFILAQNRDIFSSEGLMNLTFRSTDLSRLNELLPQNMFSRFVTATVESMALIPKRIVPMTQNISLNVQIDEGDG